MNQATRVGLRVWVRSSDNGTCYHPLHLGFFEKRIAEKVAANVDAASIAFSLRFARSAGKVDVVLGAEERVVRTLEYEPPIEAEEAPAQPDTPAFDPAKVKLVRHRFSVTQGEVSVHYDDRKLGQFGDEIRLHSSGHSGPGFKTTPEPPEEGAYVIDSWAGRGDAFWLDVARRIVTQDAAAT